MAVTTDTTNYLLTPNDRETLQRAVGILEGLSAAEEISTSVASMLEAVISMIDEVLK